MMQIHDILTAATIGVFDGLHIGHKHIVEFLVAQARERGLKPIVITFNTHPAAVIPGKTPPGRLISNEEKCRILASWGVKEVVMLEFDSKIASMTSAEFLRYIHDSFGVRMLLVGFNHKFGSDRNSTISDYIAGGARLGVEVIEATRFPHAEVSSSAVRSLITAGKVDEAAQLLDNFFTLPGTVVEGYHNGAKLGFPTANLLPDNADALLPANGVYAVRASINGGGWLPAVCNVGYRPSVSPDGKVSIEVHILDFSADIYGAPMKVQFVKMLRNEVKFDSLQQLRKQLALDCEHARGVLNEIL